jgi:hypothetical protein
MPAVGPREGRRRKTGVSRLEDGTNVREAIDGFEEAVSLLRSGTTLKAQAIPSQRMGEALRRSLSAEVKGG